MNHRDLRIILLLLRKQFGCVNRNVHACTKMAKSKKDLNFLQRVVAFCKWLWLQYQIVSCTYMMEDWEARIYSILFQLYFNFLVLVLVPPNVYNYYNMINSSCRLCK